MVKTQAHSAPLSRTELGFESLALPARALRPTACVPQPEGKALPNCELSGFPLAWGPASAAL